MDLLSMAKNFSSPFCGDLRKQYQEITTCKNIFSGNPPWAFVKKAGLYSSGGSRKMSLLNVGKAIADELSALCFCEQVNIHIDDADAKKFVLKTLEDNSFFSNFPKFLSLVFGIGGGALKVYIDGGRPCIDFVGGDNFFPTSWTSNGIYEGVFFSKTFTDDAIFTLFEHHKYIENCPCVEYSLFKSNNSDSLGVSVPLNALYDDLPEFVRYDNMKNSTMFHYFAPCSCNNIDLNSPLGISVFSNAKDTLKSIDIAFDSLSREFILGKKRIIVPSACVRTVVDPDTGNTTRYFDADDEVYVALKCDEDSDLNIKDNTTILRIDEHIKAINALLNLLCFQIGLSFGTLTFSGSQGIKTATEIISSESKTARTVKSHKNLFAKELTGLVNSILGVGMHLGAIPKKDYSVFVNFNDNIVIDDNALIINNIKLVQAGLKSKLSAVMDILKCDEMTALNELEKVKGGE